MLAVFLIIYEGDLTGHLSDGSGVRCACLEMLSVGDISINLCCLKCKLNWASSSGNLGRYGTAFLVQSSTPSR
jgi:hypothetical protein